VPLFCRHNRFEHSCPICSREKAAAAPPSAPATRRARSSGGSARAARATGVRTRRLARAADDGYRHLLVPGLRAGDDAERLAHALVVAADRLEPPGPHPAVAAEPDPEQATWLAFLLALAGPERPELQAAVAAARPRWGEEGGEDALGPDAARTIAAYRAWADRAGSQSAAFTGDPEWTRPRRFGRVFERLALPGFGRPARFELLTTLGAAGTYPLEADGLHPGGSDATTIAAKRALNSGDPLLLERRAADLASATGLPIAALDRGLALWDGTDELPDADPDAVEPVAAALGLR